MKNHHKLLAATGLMAALAFTGCRGGSGDDDAPVPPVTVTTAVPDSAGLSTAAFAAFILGLSASDESSEPLTLKDTLAVPADETSEPPALT